MTNTRLQYREISRKEPGWLYNLRKMGWDAYHNQPLPDPVINLWRFTTPEIFLVNHPDELMAPPPLPDYQEAGILKVRPEYSGYAFNRPDTMTFALLNPELIKKGVIFKDLFSAIIENGILVNNHMGHLIGTELGKFEAANLALWNSGIFLYVPPGLTIERPFLLQRHPSGPNSFHRLLIVAGKNSRISVIDDYSGECRRENALLNSAVEIFAGEAADIKYSVIQRLGQTCTSYITQRANLQKQARINTFFAGLGSSVSKVNTGTILAGRGAESRISGIVFGDSNQHFDHHTSHHHQASETFSNIDVKVALKGTANSVYTGIIRIEEDALNCEAYQENRNLLLDKGAHAESIPELEILCDQVQCTHGATMGPIDPEMLFYLQSRGLSQPEAVKTIISGFIEPTVKHLPQESEQILKDIVLNKLEG